MAWRDRRQTPPSARQNAEPKNRARFTRIDFVSEEPVAKGKIFPIFIAEISGGDGSEEVQFYLDHAPEGVEVSVDQQGTVGYARIRVDGGLAVGTRHMIAAQFVKNGKLIGSGISRPITITREMKPSPLMKETKRTHDQIELQRLRRELKDLEREPSASAREIKDMQEQIALITARREHEKCLQPPSFVAKATALLREEHELAKIGLETGRLHHQLEREWNARETEELERELKTLRLRLDLDEIDDEAVREIRELTRQLATAKLKKEITEVGRVPAKKIATPIIECVGSDGRYIVSGSVVYEDSSHANNYPVLISLAPLFGEPRVGKEVTDRDGYFSIPFNFEEKSADLHVVIGTFEEFYDNLEGPPRRPRPLKRHDMKTPPPDVVASGIFATVRWHLANWRGEAR